MINHKLCDNIKKGLLLSVWGIILYPILIFILQMLLPYLSKYVFHSNYLETMRSILVILPYFSFLMVIGVWKTASVELEIQWGGVIQRLLRILVVSYALLGFAISITALFYNLDFTARINGFKTVYWRFFVLTSLIYISLFFYRLKEKEWSLITLVFIVFSLFEDIYYYFLKIDDISNKKETPTFDGTFLTLSIIVAVGAIFIILRLRKAVEDHRNDPRVIEFWIDG